LYLTLCRIQILNIILHHFLLSRTSSTKYSIQNETHQASARQYYQSTITLSSHR